MTAYCHHRTDYRQSHSSRRGRTISTTSTTTASSADEAARLRHQLVDQLIANRTALGLAFPADVERVMRKVARHEFLPGLDLKAAYLDDAPITKRDDKGVAISSVSAPNIMAMMLAQADIQPGMSILEIGSGGLFAAYLAESTGPDGRVVTMDIDSEVTQRAINCLADAGYEHVTVLCADGEYGAPAFGPFDRIIATVGAADVPPAWVEQLKPGGRIIVPLRMNGLQRSVVFERESDHLVSRGYELCGFVPMQGVGQNRLRLEVLHGNDVGLRLDDGQRANTGQLTKALLGDRIEAWSGVTVEPMEPFDELQLWLATQLPHFGLLVATKDAVEKGYIKYVSAMGIPTGFTDDSFAYLVWRTNDDDDTAEFGAYAHGPNAKDLADRFIEYVKAWDRDQRDGPGVTIRALPHADTDEVVNDGLVLDKQHFRYIITWPDSNSTPTGQATPI